MPMARVGDIGLNYRIDGPDGAPWITFTTGMTNDLTMWDPHVEALSATHRLLRFDSRGHGGSEATPPPYTLDMLIGDIVGLWDALGIERSTLVGIGLGGVVSIGLALEHGDRLDALVPVACRSEPVPQYRAIWPPMIERARAGGIEAIADTTAERWFPEAFRAANPEIMEKIRAMIVRTSVDGYLGCIAALLTMDYTPGCRASTFRRCWSPAPRTMSARRPTRCREWPMRSPARGMSRCPGPAISAPSPIPAPSTRR